MRTVLAQLASMPGDVAANLVAVRETIGANADADLVVFPELFLSGYMLDSIDDLAVELDGAELGQVRDAARTAASAVVVGIAERRGNEVLNSAVFVAADGSLAGVYRKTHLFGAEREAFAAGSELEVIELDGRRFGPMICFEVEFPEVARTLLFGGADTLLTISANMAPFGPDHELAARARALESGLPHLYVNRSGGEAGLSFVGGSALIAPTGETVERLGEAPAALRVSLPQPGRRDERLDYRHQLRPEIYHTVESVESRGC
jgi:predicted amidohydrolase